MKRAHAEQPALMADQKKVPRDGRSDWSSTDYLQRFLREQIPSNEHEEIATKRLSATSLRHSRGKSFFKSLLRARSSSPIVQPLPASSETKHDCVVLRQEVPGKQKQYYRIVKVSSLAEENAPKDEFDVNYLFKENRVQPKKKRRKAEPSDRQDLPKFSRSQKDEISKPKPRFQFRAALMKNAATRRRHSGTERRTSDKAELNRGRSLIRRSPLVQPEEETGRIKQSTMVSRVDASVQSIDAQKQFPRDITNHAPQIQHFTPDAFKFPASELIRSWSKRQSIKSAMRSPSKNNGLHATDKLSLDSPACMRDPRSTFPQVILPKEIHQSSRKVKRSARPRPPNDRPRKLASPVKFGNIQKSDNQTNDIAVLQSSPRKLLPLALTSNPSQPSECDMIRNNAMKVTSAADNLNISTQTVFNGEERMNRESESKTFEPVKDGCIAASRVRTMSRDRSPPNTPPPASPLPPLPMMALSPKQENINSQSKKNSPLKMTVEETVVSNTPISPKSPARMIHQALKDTDKHTKILESAERFRRIPTPITSTVTSGIDCKSAISSGGKGTSNVLDFDWPQPPQSRPNSGGITMNPQLTKTSNHETQDLLLPRKQRTDNLKRRHLEDARRGSEVAKGIRPTSYASQAISDSVIELPSLRNSQADYLEIGFGQSATGSDYADSHSSPRNSRIPSRLSFVEARTGAEIRPIDILNTVSHRTTQGRTIYRSHSTQMSPRQEQEHACDVSSSKPPTLFNKDTKQPTNHHATLFNEFSSASKTQSLASDIDYEYDKDVENEADEILTVIDRMMADMELRIDEKMGAEYDRQFHAVKRKIHLLEGAVIGIWNELKELKGEPKLVKQNKSGDDKTNAQKGAMHGRATEDMSSVFV